MDGDGKSDGWVVPAKLSNRPGRPGAEAVEGRRPAKGNAASEPRAGLSAGQGVSGARAQVPRKDRDARFTALLHHVTVERLEAAYRAIRPAAAPGVDGVTWRDYGQNLEENLRGLHARVQGGAYRARPARRVFIPKPRRRMHHPIPEQGAWLARVVRGHLAYYAVPDKSEALRAFANAVIRSGSRRSGGAASDTE